MKIFIIQNCQTQFDVPFFSRHLRNNLFQIFVYYTESNSIYDSRSDIEISISPLWDNISNLDYNFTYNKSIFMILWDVFKIKPNLVILCGWYPRSHAVLAIFLRLLFNVKIGVRSDNTLIHTNLSGIKGFFKRFIMYFWLGIYDFWLPVGSLSGDYLLKLSRVSRNIYYFPYSVDVDWFRDKSFLVREECSDRRLELGLSPDDFIIIGVMKWVEREDPITLINAFIKASAFEPNLKLILIGDGPLKHEIQTLIAESNISVITPGYISYSELPFYYGISNLFIHPAKSEPYGVSVQEAMACGLPVITSNMVGSAYDFLILGENGDMYTVGDYVELADLILIYRNKSLICDISNLSKSCADKWSYKRTFNEFKSCLGLNSYNDR